MNYNFIKFIGGLFLLAASIKLITLGYSPFFIVLAFYGGMIYQSAYKESGFK